MKFLVVLLLVSLPLQARTLRVGSKTLTESVVLGEIAVQAARAAGLPVRHERELGGTQIAFKALQKGDIDLYPEYTGTLQRDLFHGVELESAAAIRRHLGTLGIGMTEPLGFNNTYAIGMREEDAKRLGIRKISDLAKHPGLKLGFSQEFMDRPEGWKSLRAAYGLPHTGVHVVEHELGYPAIATGTIAVMDLYSTDAEIAAYKLTTLEDDRAHFPVYNAVYIYRLALEKEAPELVTRLRALSGTISAGDMVAMNGQVKIGRESEGRVAAAFAKRRLGSSSVVEDSTMWGDFVMHLKEHLFLVVVALSAGLVVAIPMGIVAAAVPSLGHVILGFSGIVQTIPSLALLVFMIPLLGIGPLPAIVALFLYSLLPMVRNTYTGLRDIAAPVHESAAALGLTRLSRLKLVELPIASRAILAGVKTSAVVSVGTATLGALIGAGGFGQPILIGIRRDDISLILQGAVPAALLALLVQFLFELCERLVVPRGLRLKA